MSIHGLVLAARKARARKKPFHLSWIGPVLIAAIVAGWMLARADAANPLSDQPAHSTTSTAASPALDVPNGTLSETTSHDAAPRDHRSGVQQSNIAPAETSHDEGSLYEGSLSVPRTKVVASVDGVTLLRQSLRRGGLGSKALMTLTIRNSNDYPVKHIQLLCSFRSQDGRYVTERSRLINGVVQPNSRRTFRHMMVGFVSVNANRATCSLLSADWA